MGIFDDLTVEFQRDLEGLWRWTKRTSDGKVISYAKSGYVSCLSCYQAAFGTTTAKPLLSAQDDSGWINCAELPSVAFAGLG